MNFAGVKTFDVSIFSLLFFLLQVIVERNAKQAYSESKGGRQNITGHVAVSATGHAYRHSSFLSSHSHQVHTLDLVPMMFYMVPNEDMDSKLFFKWIDKLFVLEPAICLVHIILDGHGSHLDINMIHLLVENSIHLFCLPPHTTNILQPLDVAIFRL